MSSLIISFPSFTFSRVKVVQTPHTAPFRQDNMHLNAIATRAALMACLAVVNATPRGAEPVMVRGYKSDRSVVKQDITIPDDILTQVEQMLPTTDSASDKRDSVSERSVLVKRLERASRSASMQTMQQTKAICSSSKVAGRNAIGLASVCGGFVGQRCWFWDLRSLFRGRRSG